MADNVSLSYTCETRLKAENTGGEANKYGVMMFKKPENTSDLTRAFSVLRRANLLTLENIKALVQHAEHAKNLTWVFPELRRNNLLTLENIKAIAQHAEHVNNLVVLQK